MGGSTGTSCDENFLNVLWDTCITILRMLLIAVTMLCLKVSTEPVNPWSLHIMSDDRSEQQYTVKALTKQFRGIGADLRNTNSWKF